MGYQSKTWSLSDEVVAAVDDAKTRGESPNQFFLRLIREAQFQRREAVARTWEDNDDECKLPPARELLVELGGDDNG